MGALRLWILVLALVSFLAGTALGVLVERKNQTPAQDAALAAYATRLEQALDLSPERGRNLRDYLAAYMESVERVEAKHLARLAPAMRAELEDLGARFQRDLRRGLLTESERERLDALADDLLVHVP